MNRLTARISPCQIPITNTVVCGAAPAGFDLERYIYLCAFHLHQREQEAPKTGEETAIAESYAILRRNDPYIRRLREQQ